MTTLPRSSEKMAKGGGHEELLCGLCPTNLTRTETSEASLQPLVLNSPPGNSLLKTKQKAK